MNESCSDLPVSISIFDIMTCHLNNMCVETYFTESNDDHQIGQWSYKFVQFLMGIVIFERH